MEAPLALYRRYRPDTYAEVIGQDHVTEPLRQALISNRVHHAYLFSGPRGCGKTTSARILARCLNCEKGPTPEPCGSCQSCQDLARGGPGSIDVIEIDAASHGGVDDARDLRERAFFSPVAARYKIYIVDEAHMVTTQGFNALLKLVEEPPEHLKFIFATTEPDKVIGTIRSRTHHYPFRLVPPKVLQDYLAELCTREDVVVEAAALPLVVRAGGGSVRDTLSVLDQLIGGAGGDGLTYAHAVSLLGYTHESLLDEVVDALAAGDGASVFAVIDKVIESGQDPRRFAEDLLQRLRDLVIVSAVPDAAVRGLLEGPPDQAERLGGQAARFGAAELSRAADVLNTGLTEMRGATAPRLHLELICARILLPGADDSDQGVHARLDRVERRLSIASHDDGAAGGQGREAGGEATRPPARSRTSSRAEASGADEAGASAADAPPAAPGSTGSTAPADSDRGPAAGGSAKARPAAKAKDQVPAGAKGQAAAVAKGQAAAGAEEQAAAGAKEQAAGAAEHPPAGAEVGAAVGAEAGAGARPGGVVGAEEQAAGAQSGRAGSADSAGPVPGDLSLGDVRRLWPDILESVKNARRFAWVMLSQNAQVTALHAGVLTVGLVNAGARDSFSRSGSEEVLRQALRDVLGVDWRIEAVVDPSTGGGGGGLASGGGPDGGTPGVGRPASATGGSGAGNAGATEPGTGGQVAGGHGAGGRGTGGGSRSGTGRAGASRAGSGRAGAGQDSPGQDSPGQGSGGQGPTSWDAGQDRAGHNADSDVDPDTDTVLPDTPTSHADLLRREFGAELIEERSAD